MVDGLKGSWAGVLHAASWEGAWKLSLRCCNAPVSDICRGAKEQLEEVLQLIALNAMEPPRLGDALQTRQVVSWITDYLTQHPETARKAGSVLGGGLDPLRVVAEKRMVTKPLAVMDTPLMCS
ncbi:unnamed protein product [Lota lota]